MASESPASILFSRDGYDVVITDGYSVIAEQPGIIASGVDGAIARFISVDGYGQTIIVGAGTAGVTSGGVVSVQGVSGGTDLPISAASLPLPTGAATDRTLASDPFSFRLSDGSNFYNTVTASQLPAALVGGRLDVVVGAALPAGTNNIGDVDVLTVPAPLSTTGGGTEATALRVTLASDSTGLVSIDDNGGSLTIDTPQLPSSLVSGRLDINIGSWLGSIVPTVGQKNMVDSIPVTMASNQSPVQVIDAGAAGTAPTFFAIYDRIAPATNKYMALLFNTSLTKKLVVYRINRYNWQVAAVTGQTLEQYLVKVSDYTGGTSAPIRTTDSIDTLPAGVTSVTGAATVTEDFLIRRLFASSEEANLSNANFYNALTLDYSVSIYERTIGTRGLVLRANEGLAIRNVTNSTAGTVSYIMEFIVEDV